MDTNEFLAKFERTYGTNYEYEWDEDLGQIYLSYSKKLDYALDCLCIEFSESIFVAHGFSAGNSLLTGLGRLFFRDSFHTQPKKDCAASAIPFPYFFLNCWGMPFTSLIQASLGRCSITSG